jgi:hypothetical protein
MSHNDPHEALGRQIVYEVLKAQNPDYHIVGAGAGSFDFSTLINAAAEAANKGIEYKQGQDAANASSAAQDDKLRKSILADASWADAETTLAIVKQSGDASKIAAAQSLANAMQSAAVSTAAGLDSDHTAKRMEAAQRAMNNASQAALSSSSPAAQAKMAAWQKVLTSIASAPSTALATTPDASVLARHGFGGGGSSNFFTQKYGGVPVWGWAAGGAVVLTGLALVLRRRK